MEQEIIQLTLTVIEDALQFVSASPAITNVVSLLQKLVPVIVQEYNDLLAPVQNIIAALKANPAATSDQLDTLASLDSQVDAAFDAAAAAYVAANP